MMTTKKNYDFLIIGAGVIGLCTALQLKRKNSRSRIAVIEKEDAAGFHSSGRNSGVLHAGFYYTADSLKAKFTKDGNEYFRDYCKTKKLSLLQCGKLVVTKSAEDLSQLNELFQRAKANQVTLHEITESDAQKIEPRVKTYQKAAWSPNTATVDPNEIMKSLADEATQMGIDLHYNCAYQSRHPDFISTQRGPFSVGYVINTAGLYADQIAKDFNFSKDYRILPFKGLYLYCTSQEKKLNTHIYPVPNLNNPFLGVHHTLTLHGNSKIGPTAIPAFWREQYQGFSRFNLSECLAILKDEVSLFFKAGFDFKGLALEEMKKYNRGYLVKESMSMLEDVELADYQKWGKPGIRAQLFNTQTQKLEMDFKVEHDQNSMHVLNAVSPAFTCAQPFAKYICELI